VEAGFKAAAGMFREPGAPFNLAVTMLEHAEWLARGDRGDEAEPLVRGASEVFERLRATPWIERSQRLLGTPAAAG